MRVEGGDKTMAQVLNCVLNHGLEAVLVAVELVIESGVLSTEHLLNVLARFNAPPTPQTVESSLPLRDAPVANTGRYDSLRGMTDTDEDADEQTCTTLEAWPCVVISALNSKNCACTAWLGPGMN